MTTPHPNDDDVMREALRRDAGRVGEPAFDATLHHATMRRIRGLASRSTENRRTQILLRFAAAAAVVVLATFVALKHPGSVRKEAGHATANVVPLPAEAPRASALAYR